MCGLSLFCWEGKKGLDALHPSLAVLPCHAGEPPPRVRQRGQARRSPILQVGKLRLRLPLPGYLHGYRPGVWTQAPTGGLWVRTDLSCLSFSICQIRIRSNRCELVQVKCLDPAWRALGAAVLTGASERQPGAEGESGHRVREGLRGPCLVAAGRWPSRRGLAVRCLLLSPA